MGLDAGDFRYAGRNFSNVSFEVEDGQLTISKREVVVKPKDASRVFNGEALEASEWEVAEGSPDQFLAGQGISDPVFSGSQTAPGTSESSIVSWGYPENTKAGNYEIRTEKGTLNVTSRGAAETITVEANSTSATYDGGTHSAAGLKTTEFVVGGKAYTVSGLSTEDPSAADAGTYTNNVTGTAKVSDAAGNDVTSEFAVEIKDGSLVIGPARGDHPPQGREQALRRHASRGERVRGRRLRRGRRRRGRDLRRVADRRPARAGAPSQPTRRRAPPSSQTTGSPWARAGSR